MKIPQKKKTNELLKITLKPNLLSGAFGKFKEAAVMQHPISSRSVSHEGHSQSLGQNSLEYELAKEL